MNQRWIPIWTDDPSEEDVAKFLNVGRDTVYRLARSGEIPGCQRYGGQYRVIRKIFLREIGGK